MVGLLHILPTPQGTLLLSAGREGEELSHAGFHSYRKLRKRFGVLRCALERDSTNFLYSSNVPGGDALLAIETEEIVESLKGWRSAGGTIHSLPLCFQGEIPHKVGACVRAYEL